MHPCSQQHGLETIKLLAFVLVIKDKQVTSKVLEDSSWRKDLVLMDPVMMISWDPWDMQGRNTTL